jgi:hypothetical protein
MGPDVLTPAAAYLDQGVSATPAAAHDTHAAARVGSARSQRPKGLKELAMRIPAGCRLLAAIVLPALCIDVAFAQHDDMAMGMSMPTTTLLAAQLDAKQVVDGSASRASGTGAFLLDPTAHTLAFQLTYQGLESGAASRIALHNFGSGRNGETVRVLCGDGGPACPGGTSATIEAVVANDDKRPLDNALIGEFDSERVYVEIVGGNGKPEIRGQLAPNGAMVMVTSYVAHLAPGAGVDSKGAGTAILSETHLPGGKVSVYFAATVSAPAGVLKAAGLVADANGKHRGFTAGSALPQLKVSYSADPAAGGSLSTLYFTAEAKAGAPLAARLVKLGNGSVGVIVATSKYPAGELYGVLVPVR